MFDVHCRLCDRRYLVGTRSIASFHNTSDGPIAYVRCPEGHLLVRHFRRNVTTPPTAVDVDELLDSTTAEPVLGGVAG